MPDKYRDNWGKSYLASEIIRQANGKEGRYYDYYYLNQRTGEVWGSDKDERHLRPGCVQFYADIEGQAVWEYIDENFDDKYQDSDYYRCFGDVDEVDLAEAIKYRIKESCYEPLTYGDLRRERKEAKKERNAEPYWKVLRDFRRSLNNFNWGVNARARNCVAYFEHPVICWDDVKNDISDFYGVSVWNGLCRAKNNGMKSRNKFYQLAKKLILESPSYVEYSEEHERANDNCKPDWATR